MPTRKSNWFDGATDIVNSAENSFINFLSALAPWGVPVIPAYLTFEHTRGDLSFPDWVAWVAAFVVEVLGLASMRTAIWFWTHNKRYASEKNRAPVWLAIATYVFYLVIILTVNVLLDLRNGVNGTNVLAIGLFSLLSLPAGLLIAIRAQHTELLEILSKPRVSRSSSENIPENQPSTSGNSSRTSLASRMFSRNRSKRLGRRPVHQESVFAFMDETLSNEGRVADFTEVVSRLGLSNSTASRLRNEWIEQNSERINGGGDVQRP